MATAQTPVWIVKYAPQKNARGRKHMAVYFPHGDALHQDPLDKNSPQHSKGLLIHAIGSAMGGYRVEFKRNYDATNSQGLQSAIRVGAVDTARVPACHFVDKEFIARGGPGDVDTLALQVQPPRVATDLRDANTIKDCQDWLCDFFQHLLRRGVVTDDALQKVVELKDPPVPILGPAGSASEKGKETILTNSASPAAAFAASTGRAAAPASASNKTPRFTNSEWDSQRRTWRRFNTATGHWEFYDQTQRKFATSD